LHHCKVIIQTLVSNRVGSNPTDFNILFAVKGASLRSFLAEIQAF
jgi:hypothetical protein